MVDASLYLSLKVALCAMLLAAAPGTLIAYLLARKTFPGRSLLEGVAILPLVLPPTVLGYYLLVLMARDSAVGRFYHHLTGADLTFGFGGIVIAAALGGFPLYVRQAKEAFAAVDRDLELAAKTDGAGSWQVFTRITAPLARSGLVAGAVLAFARALGDFGATLMVGGNFPGRTRTLALGVYDAWQDGRDHTAAALCLILSAIALCVSVAASRLARDR